MLLIDIFSDPTIICCPALRGVALATGTDVAVVLVIAPSSVVAFKDDRTPSKAVSQDKMLVEVKLERYSRRLIMEKPEGISNLATDPAP